jgi:hypothetical protein
MWAVLIIIDPPRFDLGPRIFDRRELMDVPAVPTKNLVRADAIEVTAIGR